MGLRMMTGLKVNRQGGGRDHRLQVAVIMGEMPELVYCR